ncbi:MAG TPA: hypothetical protein VLB86_16035 [Gaiellaceae bacterium]|nr:hypothetical protein [Gaiellaceae bacterium]
MILGSAWAWAVVGVAIFLLVGVLAALALGLVPLPREAVRRRQAPDADVVRGVELPAEVPEQTAGEAAAEADRLDRGADA